MAVAIILIDGREKPNRHLGFELQTSRVIENRNKVVMQSSLPLEAFMTRPQKSAEKETASAVSDVGKEYCCKSNNVQRITIPSFLSA